MNRIHLLSLVTLLMFCFSTVQATKDDERITIFLDCEFCNTNQIKQELNYVNFAFDVFRSDVHVFMTRQFLPNGAFQFFVEVIGIDEWDDERVTFDFSSEPNMSNLEQNALIIDKIKIGLAPFLAKTSLIEKLELNIPQIEERNAVQQELTFWENWIYDLDANFSWNSEASNDEFRVRLGFEADNTTPEWRIRFRESYSYRQERFRSNEEVIVATRRSIFSSASAVKSLTNHWSVGASGSFYSDNFNNIDQSWWLGPAIEYSVFPYDDVPAREFTFAYRVGVQDRKYLEETIYERLEETLFRQSLNADLRLRKTWGSVFAGLRGSNYIGDWEKNSLAFNTRISLRVTKGLAVTVGGNYEIVNDQISLPRQEATKEELLLAIRQIATNYESRINFGLSYTFGALYNNIINTRL